MARTPLSDIADIVAATTLSRHERVVQIAAARAEAFRTLPGDRWTVRGLTIAASGARIERNTLTVDVEATRRGKLVWQDTQHYSRPPLLIPDVDGAVRRLVRITDEGTLRSETETRWRLDPAAILRQIIVETIGDIPEPHFGHGSTLTAYGIAGDDSIYGYDGTYSVARSEAYNVDSDGTRVRCGQRAVYSCSMGVAGFDTSSVGDGDTVSSAVFSAYGLTDGSTTDFTLEARGPFSWTGGGVTTDDFVPGTSQGGYTLLAHFATSGWSTSGYNAFTNDAMPANVSKTGNTEFFVTSDRFRAGTTPTGDEYVDWYESDTAGTTYDVKLVVEYGSAAVSANAEVSTGTGAAQAASVKISPRATGVGTGTGAAQTPSTKVSPRATGIGTGTGAAYAVTAKVKASAGSAAGTGTAYNATGVPGRRANAEVSTGTGAAYAVTAKIKASAGVATGVGQAYNVTAKIVVNAGVAAGTGATADAHASIKASAGSAAGTGAAAAPSASIKASAGSAAGTGASADGTISYNIDVTAECARGTGEAHQPKIYLGPLTVTLSATTYDTATPSDTIVGTAMPSDALSGTAALSDAIQGTAALSDAAVGSVTTSEA